MMNPPNANTCLLLTARKHYNRPVNGHITGSQKPTRQKNVITDKKGMH